jgi:acyl carrier protein
VKEKLKSFLAKNRNIDGLADGDDLFEKGFVDSLFALQLIMFLEKEFKLRIPNDMIKEDNFRSVERIAATVATLTGEA